MPVKDGEMLENTMEKFMENPLHFFRESWVLAFLFVESPPGVAKNKFAF